MALRLHNGKITRIDAPAAPTSGGDEAWTTGATVDLDVLLDEPTRAQRIALGALAVDVSRVIYVSAEDLPSGVSVGAKVVANYTDRSSVTYRVLKIGDWVWKQLSHYVLFVKEF